MTTQAKIAKIQGSLDTLTTRWWLYLLLTLLFFIPLYASEGYDPRQSMNVIGQALSAPLIFGVPALMPIAKVVPVALILGVFAYGNRMRRVFNAYVALLYLALALLQTAAVTDTYGVVVMSGNLALVLVVALFWVWEVAAERNDFHTGRTPMRRWWVAPLALVSLLSPVDPGTMSPDFTPARWMTNEAGLTFCMMTPVVLAVLVLFHPRVNLALLRVTSFAGIVLGVVNSIVWFGVQSWGWWMGVLHIPLLAISVYAFTLALVRERPASPIARPAPPRADGA